MYINFSIILLLYWYLKTFVAVNLILFSRVMSYREGFQCNALSLENIFSSKSQNSPKDCDYFQYEECFKIKWH